MKDDTLNSQAAFVPFFLQCDKRAPQESPASPEPMMTTSASVGTSSPLTAADKCVEDPPARNLAGLKALTQDAVRQTHNAR